MQDRYESEQRDLDPNRGDEQRAARFETESRLTSRNIAVRSDDKDVELADLLDAVEQFEDTVTAMGGDLMVDHIGSDRPVDPAFVLPARRQDEPVPVYRLRVLDARERLRDRSTPPST
jgi:hypothetical protein